MKKWMIAAALSTCAVFAVETFQMNAESITLNVESYAVCECAIDAENHEMTVAFQSDNDSDHKFTMQVVKSDVEASTDEGAHAEKIEGQVPMELQTVDTETSRTLRLVFEQNSSRYCISFNMEKPIADGLEDHYRSVIDMLAASIQVSTTEEAAVVEESSEEQSEEPIVTEACCEETTSEA
ncbi:MAG: hypothetical protein H7A40_04870 [Chlamydiales bacterium]|nr:hypothetical protein [Chlamydiales bacterium]